MLPAALHLASLASLWAAWQGSVGVSASSRANARSAAAQFGQTDIGYDVDLGTSFNMKYNGCGVAKSDIGVAIYNGELKFSQSIMTSGASANISQAFKGRITVVGAYDDFLDVDVSQSVAVGDLGASGTGVSVVLKGTITTSESTFTFDESIEVTAGKISAKITASK